MKTTWSPPSPDRFEVTALQTTTTEEGFAHESARLRFTDWLDRPCEVYVERIVPTGDALPALVHCVGGGQIIYADSMLFWARHGFACASFDWQIGEFGHRPEAKTSRWPDGVAVQHAQTNTAAEAILPLAIQAALVCLNWLGQHEQVDAKRLGLHGISWGGYLTWAAAAYTNQLRAIAPVYGSGIFNDDDTPLGGRNLPPEVAALWFNNWDPQGVVARQKAPACYLSASNDFFGRMNRSLALLRKLTVPHRHSFLPNADHSLSTGEGNLALAWMRHYLTNGPALPETPRLSPSLEIEADYSQKIESADIWWTANGETPPRFRCWHQGKPPGGAARLAFVRVQYAAGFTLCSDVVELAPAPASFSVTPIWPDIRNGLGWRWELGSTQAYGNEVGVGDLVNGHVEITPSKGPQNAPVAVLLNQVSDPYWKLPTDATLHLDWSIPGDADPQLEAVAIAWHGGEVELVCQWSDGTLVIQPPAEGWAKHGTVRVTSRAPRSTFALGPLEWVEA